MLLGSETQICISLLYKYTQICSVVTAPVFTSLFLDDHLIMVVVFHSSSMEDWESFSPLLKERREENS